MEVLYGSWKSKEVVNGGNRAWQNYKMEETVKGKNIKDGK